MGPYILVESLGLYIWEHTLWTLSLLLLGYLVFLIPTVYLFKTYDSHSQVIVVVIQISRFLKRKSSIISSQISNCTNHHFTQGWMHVKEKCSVDVPAAHLAKVGLVPADPRGLIYLVKTGPQGQSHE